MQLHLVTGAMLNTTQGNDLQLDADVTVGVARILQVTKAIGKTAPGRRSRDGVCGRKTRARAWWSWSG